MLVQITRSVPKYERVEETTEVRDVATVPSWIAKGCDCFHCGFPLTEMNHPASHAVAADLKSVGGVSWFHQSCWQKIQSHG